MVDEVLMAFAVWQDMSYGAVQNKMGVAFIVVINQTISSMFGYVSQEKARISSDVVGCISSCWI
jgi:hypothetical protein